MLAEGGLGPPLSRTKVEPVVLPIVMVPVAEVLLTVAPLVNVRVGVLTVSEVLELESVPPEIVAPEVALNAPATVKLRVPEMVAVPSVFGKNFT